MFNDDDVDIAVFSEDLPLVRSALPALLSSVGTYVPFGTAFCDRVRPRKNSAVWIDVFALKRYDDLDAILRCITLKDNGQAQPPSYVDKIVEQLPKPFVPLWHYEARKAIEMWPLEYFPLSSLSSSSSSCRTSLFGHLTLPICERPVEHLMRCYGKDCFDVYTVAGHALHSKEMKERVEELQASLLLRDDDDDGAVAGRKFRLEPCHYLPVQHTSRALRIESCHSEETLRELLRKEAPPPPTDEPPRSDALSTSPSPDALVVSPSTLDDLPSPPPSPPPASLPPKQSWFGATVRSVSSSVSSDPAAALSFTPELLAAMEPHVAKARKVRNTALQAYYLSSCNSCETATTKKTTTKWCHDKDHLLSGRSAVLGGEGFASFSFDVSDQRSGSDDGESGPGTVVGKSPNCFGACRRFLTNEGKLSSSSAAATTTTSSVCASSFQACKLRSDLAAVLLPPDVLSAVVGVPCYSCLLSELHHSHASKSSVLSGLLSPSLRSPFHESYESFVLSCLCPIVMSRTGAKTVRYQSFPVVRVVRPGDFSIGVHCDAAYGFHPNNVNV